MPTDRGYLVAGFKVPPLEGMDPEAIDDLAGVLADTIADQMADADLAEAALVEHPGHGSQKVHGRRTNVAAVHAELAAGGQPHIAGGTVDAFMDYAATAEGHPDLTELHVDGTLKFGDDGLGYARDAMPQLPEDRRGEYFANLESRGISVKQETVSALSLKPTQKEVSAKKSGQIYGAMKNGQFREENRLTVSSDNFVLDGHHRWGASTAMAFHVKGVTIGIDRVDMPMRELLADATAWTQAAGIATKAMGVEALAALGLTRSEFDALVESMK